MSGCTAPADDDGGLAAPPAVDAPSTLSTATTCIRCHAPAVISARGTTHCRSCFLHSLHSRFTKAIQGAKLAARDGVDQYERSLLTGTTSSPEKGPPAGTRRKSRMVVACSGGPASTALVNLVYRSLFASSPTPIRASDDPAAAPTKNKRGDRYSQFQPFEKCDVVYIDESAVPGFGSDRTDEVRKLVASISPDIAFTALRLEDIFDGADSPLVVSTTSADLPVLASASSSSADAAPTSARDRLVSLLSPSSPTSLSPTALASLHRSMLNSLLLSHARKQGADVLFLAETGTRTAIRVLSGMSEGRGYSAGEEVAAEYVSRGRSAPSRDRAGPRNGSAEEEPTPTAPSSDSDAAVLVVRPLAQMVNKEIVFYNRDAELEALVMVNPETIVRPRGEEALEISAKKRSIPGLVEDFIVTLDADFPSTVPTVVRTAHKLGLRSSHAAFLSHSADEQSSSIASSETAALCPMCGLPAQPRADEWRKAITISDLQGALAQAAASSGADQQPTKRTLVEERSAAADGKPRKREPYQPSKAHLLGGGEEVQSAEAATASGGERDVAASNGVKVASSAGENATEIKDEPSPASDSTLAPYLCYGCLLVLFEQTSSHGATQSAVAKRKAAARGGAGATAGVRADQLALPPYVEVAFQVRRGHEAGGLLARTEVRGEEGLRKEVEQYLL